MELIEKAYFIPNSAELDRRFEIINNPSWCLRATREYIEMDYSKVTVICLENQVMAIENALAPCM